MSGLMLAYFERPSSEIKMDVHSGSWFGTAIISIIGTKLNIYL